MWREFNLINSFTLEISFMGPNRGVNAGLHFNTKMMRQIGRDFCQTLVDYVMNQDLVNKILAELKVRYP
jgi:regulator of sigma D